MICEVAFYFVFYILAYRFCGLIYFLFHLNKGEDSSMHPDNL